MRGCASKKTLFALEQARADVALARRRWKGWQHNLDPHRLVFIDETWIRTNMAPLRGWGPKGKRLRGFTPHGRWRTLTFIAALRVDRIDAPCVFDGPINGQKFLAYVERFLLPTLRPGDIVVLDNLGSHKSKAVRAAIRSSGAHRIFQPPYSPDLNPIEQAFAKLKHWLRQAQPRSIDEIYTALAPILDNFTPEQCAAFFKNAGYASA